MNRGRPKTKVNTQMKKLDPKYKVRLDAKTTVYVRNLEVLKEVWRPLYPNLEVIN